VIQTITTMIPEANPSHKCSHLLILLKRESLLFFLGVKFLLEVIIVRNRLVSFTFSYL